MRFAEIATRLDEITDPDPQHAELAHRVRSVYERRYSDLLKELARDPPPGARVYADPDRMMVVFPVRELGVHAVEAGSDVFREIHDALERLGWDVTPESYREGIATREVEWTVPDSPRARAQGLVPGTKMRRTVKKRIAVVLRELAEQGKIPREEAERLRRAFENDATRRGAATERRGEEPVVVVSFSALEAAHVTAGRSWSSCWRIGGAGEQDFVCALRKGIVTAWLTTEDDVPDLDDPTARWLVRVFGRKDRTGRWSFWFEPVTSFGHVHGTPPEWAERAVAEALRRLSRRAARAEGRYPALVSDTDDGEEAVRVVQSTRGLVAWLRDLLLGRGTLPLRGRLSPADVRDALRELANGRTPAAGPARALLDLLDGRRSDPEHLGTTLTAMARMLTDGLLSLRDLERIVPVLPHDPHVLARIYDIVAESDPESARRFVASALRTWSPDEVVRGILTADPQSVLHPSTLLYDRILIPEDVLRVGFERLEKRNDPALAAVRGVDTRSRAALLAVFPPDVTRQLFGGTIGPEDFRRPDFDHVDAIVRIVSGVADAPPEVRLALALREPNWRLAIPAVSAKRRDLLEGIHLPPDPRLFRRALAVMAESSDARMRDVAAILSGRTTVPGATAVLVRLVEAGLVPSEILDPVTIPVGLAQMFEHAWPASVRDPEARRRLGALEMLASLATGYWSALYRAMRDPDPSGDTAETLRIIARRGDLPGKRARIVLAMLSGGPVEIPVEEAGRFVSDHVVALGHLPRGIRIVGPREEVARTIAAVLPSRAPRSALSDPDRGRASLDLAADWSDPETAVLAVVHAGPSWLPALRAWVRRQPRGSFDPLATDGDPATAAAVAAVLDRAGWIITADPQRVARALANPRRSEDLYVFVDAVDDLGPPPPGSWTARVVERLPAWARRLLAR